MTKVYEIETDDVRTKVAANTPGEAIRIFMEFHSMEGDDMDEITGIKRVPMYHELYDQQRSYVLKTGKAR